jgi:glucose-1-phosphate cytidylyltransferase
MQRSNELAQVPVVILCGGKGVMLDEAQTQRTNKALIRVQGQPLLYWVMQTYALHGSTEFILALGFQAEHFGPALLASGAQAVPDVADRYTLNLGGVSCQLLLVTTPAEASTGARLLACRAALTALGQRERFAVTYSDTLSDVDLGAEMRFHKKQGLIATIVAAKLPVRFRVLGIRTGEVLVRGFAGRPVIEGASINGGYYVFTPAFWQAVSTLNPDVALENQPLEQLAAAGQLAAYEHKGAWQTCDAERDLAELDRLACQLADRTAV